MSEVNGSLAAFLCAAVHGTKLKPKLINYPSKYKCAGAKSIIYWQEGEMFSSLLRSEIELLKVYLYLPATHKHVDLCSECQ